MCVCVCARVGFFCVYVGCVCLYACGDVQAAFECMYTLLETCLSKLDIFEFLKKVEAGVTDHYDIKVILSWLLLEYYTSLLIKGTY